MVPQRHNGVRLHPDRGAHHPDCSAPKSGALPIASDQPHNVFTYLGPGHSMNVEEPVTALCPESLCSRPREPTLDRWRSLASDLSVVTAHRLAPRDIEERLPAVDQ